MIIIRLENKKQLDNNRNYVERDFYIDKKKYIVCSYFATEPAVSPMEKLLKLVELES